MTIRLKASAHLKGSLALLKKCRSILMGSTLCTLQAINAQAHPHVWIAISEKLLFTADGKFSGIQSVWSFDELYSAFTTQGLPIMPDGHLKADTLIQLAESFSKKLTPVNYFTSVKSDGTELTFDTSTNNKVEFDGKQIVYSFTLPMKEPLKLGGVTVFTTIDPINFVAFSSTSNGAVVQLGEGTSACSFNKKSTPADTQSPQTEPNNSPPHSNTGSEILSAINAPYFSIYC